MYAKYQLLYTHSGAKNVLCPILIQSRSDRAYHFFCKGIEHYFAYNYILDSEEAARAPIVRD